MIKVESGVCGGALRVTARVPDDTSDDALQITGPAGMSFGLTGYDGGCRVRSKTQVLRGRY